MSLAGDAGDKSSFTLKLLHGGTINKGRGPTYVGGQTAFFNNIEQDEFGFIVLREKLTELGYSDNEVKCYAFSQSTLRELQSDDEVWSLGVNELNPKREVEIWVNSTIVEEGIQYDKGTEGDAENDGQSEDCSDSEYGMDNTTLNRDDFDFDQNVGPTIEYSGVEINYNEPTGEKSWERNLDEPNLSDEASLKDSDSDVVNNPRKRVRSKKSQQTNSTSRKQQPIEPTVEALVEPATNPTEVHDVHRPHPIEVHGICIPHPTEVHDVLTQEDIDFEMTLNSFNFDDLIPNGVPIEVPENNQVSSHVEVTIAAQVEVPTEVIKN
nr:uncharacterized protein LOC109191245 [Ipomoea batatas]